MDIWVHSIVTTILIVILWPFFGAWALLAAVSGILIDADHVFWHMLKTGKLNLKKAYKYCKKIGNTEDKAEYHKMHLILHTYDTFLLGVALAMIWPIFIPLTIGHLIHLIMDFIWVEIQWNGTDFKLMFSKSTFKFLFKLISGEKINT